MSIVIASEDRALSCAEVMTGKTVVRGRVCNRAGCGRILLTLDGKPEFNRQFCSRKCRLADLRDQKRFLRAEFHGGKCPLCGRRGSGAPLTDPSPSPDPGVASNTGPRSDASRGGVWGVLKVGWGPPGASQREIATRARRVDLPRGRE